MIGEDVIVLDFETTGLSARLGRATEVAAIRLVDGRIVSHYQSLINPGITLSPFIIELTGITNEMLAEAPPPEAVFPELHRFVGRTPVFAHNAPFDEGFYRVELERLGLAPPAESFLCTKLIARRVLPGLDSYRLGNLAAHLDIRFKSSAHRAHADAEVLARVLNALCRKIQEHGIERVEVRLLQRLMRFSPVADATAYLKELARSQRQGARVATRRAPPVQPAAAKSPVAPKAQPVSADERMSLPSGWVYYQPAAANASQSGAGSAWKTARGQQVPWFAEPETVLKLRVVAQARAERADWIYLESHRCLIETATGDTYHVLGWPQDSAGLVRFTLKTGPPVVVDRLKLLRPG